MDSGTEIRETVQLLEDAIDASRRGSWLSAKLLTDNASRRIERIRLAEIASTPYLGENLLDYVRMGFMIVGIVLVGKGRYAENQGDEAKEQDKSLHHKGQLEHFNHNS